jgi:ABC-2 type transport system permease protein
LPPDAANAAVLRAFVGRDFRVSRSYRFALLLEVFFGAVDLGVYFFISRTFPDVQRADLAGAPSYFAFAAVGIAVSVVVNAASASVSNRLRQEQLTGTLEAVASQPVSAWQLALGVVGAPYLASMARAGMYVLIGALVLGLDVSTADWRGFAAVLLVSGVALAGIGIASGALTLVVKRGEFAAALAIFAMGVLGGALFPVSVLPSALQWLGELMPTRFAFDGLRAALFRGTGWGDDLLVLAAFAAVLLPASVALLAAALRAAKRSGSLAEY